jgi:tetratricopeptide (TPR) repeat protein
VYLGLSVLLSPVPLLNVLQAESSAVVALVAFFVAGHSALGSFASEEASLGGVLASQEVALIIPLGTLTLAQLWAPNCTYAQGLLFYVLFPGVTVVLAVALAYALGGTDLTRPGLALATIGGLIVIGGPLYDLGLHPQFYTYNHVFGGVLGPIYDEQLAVRPGLFAFRGLTLLWALAAVLVGRWLRGKGPRWGLPICALAIGAVYVCSASLGINTPAWYLQEQLRGHEQTPHFDLYYDPEQLGEADVAALAKAHEARYEWVRRRLHRRADEEAPRIQSYIYPNPDVKGRLTGARTTSVSPVWLSRPQVHLLRRRVSTSLGHELAHALSRPYGLPGLQASWAPGLIEGWAVALETPAPGPSPDDLVLTATLADTSTGLTAEATAIANRLSPWGFWTGRGAVSYATMGSFVQYLLDRYGPEKLKRVYAWANFEEVYGRPLRALAAGWAAHLRRTSVVSRGAHEVVTRQFTSPSLFEKECPHYVPPSRQHLQAARRAARRQDTTQAVANLRRALAAQPQFAAAHEALARFRLAQGRAEAVVHQLDTLDTGVRTLSLRVARADAEALLGNAETAQTLYARARARAPHSTPAVRTRLALREAVASRPAIVRTLVSGDSAAVQARRLERPGEQMRPARQAWRGIRLMEANRYGQALAVWRTIGSPIRSDRPRGWHRAWDLQRTAWTAKAALRAGSTDVARRWGQRAARRAQRVGDRSWATLLDWWARRAGTSKTGTTSSGRVGQPCEMGDSR